jgi:hypothetical protein
MLINCKNRSNGTFNFEVFTKPDSVEGFVLMAEHLKIERACHVMIKCLGDDEKPLTLRSGQLHDN